MNLEISTTILIVGAGPVGLTLAMDLSSRGVDVTVVEQRSLRIPAIARCNQISARSMEIFRRLGLSATLRELGLPSDYPNDVVSRTTATGIELSRISIPARGKRSIVTDGPDARWPTPEHTHRINQSYFEPVFVEYASSRPNIRILDQTKIENLEQEEDQVVADVLDLENGRSYSIECHYLIGCDGAKSIVRNCIGAKLDIRSAAELVQSTQIRAPELLGLMPGRPAWLCNVLNSRQCGVIMAIDGKELWQIHNYFYRDEPAFDAVNRDSSIRTMLGVGPDFPYEIVSKVDWTGQSRVANKFRDRRVFICGDAAHLWLPHAGYGMNAGIADAANLSWLLAATIKGWASSQILDCYELERQPVADQIADITADIAEKINNYRRNVPEEIEWDGPIGDATRARIGEQAYALDVQQQCCGGLNFGYSYQNSPIIIYDEDKAPSFTMHEFTQSTAPGCRAPHFWLDNRRSFYDVLGEDYTLVRSDRSVEVDEIKSAAEHRGMPLKILDLHESEMSAVYRHKLVLIRPDRHIAWRRNSSPVDPLELIDTIRGA